MKVASSLILGLSASRGVYALRVAASHASKGARRVTVRWPSAASTGR